MKEEEQELGSEGKKTRETPCELLHKPRVDEISGYRPMAGKEGTGEGPEMEFEHGTEQCLHHAFHRSRAPQEKGPPVQ